MIEYCRGIVINLYHPSSNYYMKIFMICFLFLNHSEIPHKFQIPGVVAKIKKSKRKKSLYFFFFFWFRTYRYMYLWSQFHMFSQYILEGSNIHIHGWRSLHLHTPVDPDTQLVKTITVLYVNYFSGELSKELLFYFNFIFLNNFLNALGNCNWPFLYLN